MSVSGWTRYLWIGLGVLAFVLIYRMRRKKTE